MDIINAFRNMEIADNYRVSLRRGTKKELENIDMIFSKNLLICEIPEELSSKSFKELVGIKVKYKISDGKSLYKDLPYEDGLIPVAFYQ